MSVSLTGRWLAEEIGGLEAVNGVRVILDFQTSGGVGGSGGCNAIRGQASIKGLRVAFSPMAATRMACPPDVLDQEARVLAGLAETRRHRIEEEALVLLSEGGVPTLRLRRLP
ncbi:MAG: META domain-containing protein [Beijerinckiaceae bacterium]